MSEGPSEPNQARPLNDLLDAIEVLSSAIVRFTFHGDFAVGFDYETPITLSVTSGEIFAIDPEGGRLKVAAGDTLILPRGSDGGTVRLSSSSSSPVQWVGAENLFQTAEPFEPGRGSLAPQEIILGDPAKESSRTEIISFAFGWKETVFGPLLKGMPALISVKREADMLGLIRMLEHQLFPSDITSEAGSGAQVRAAAQFFLVSAFRSYFGQEMTETAGPLRGLLDPKLSRALQAIAADPGYPWELNELAKISGMSRSTFATQFSLLMGQTPFAYLRSVRMHLAQRALRETQISITELSQDLGYRSEAAFRAAFRAETGSAPKKFALKHTQDRTY